MKTRKINYLQDDYSGSQLSEVQEPHPQPPPRKRRGGYDVPHLIRKSYTLAKALESKDMGFCVSINTF
jgi:hypothetical protein